MLKSVGGSVLAGLGSISGLVPRGSTFSWLLAYFFFNLALTIYNKLVLAGNFPFPYTLTAVHALSGTIGSWICLKQGVFTAARLTRRETIQIVLFSGLYTINIIVSNVSLYAFFATKLTVDTLSQYPSIKLCVQQHPYSSLPYPCTFSRNPTHHKHTSLSSQFVLLKSSLMTGYHWRRISHSWRLLLHHPRLPINSPGNPPGSHKNNPHKQNAKKHFNSPPRSRSPPPHVPTSLSPIPHLRIPPQRTPQAHRLTHFHVP
jgi:hypothetical protein